MLLAAEFCKINGTYILPADNSEAIRAAGNLLRQGNLVVFPTETVYGLGADAFNEDAVASIYKAKGRPQDNPLIVHIKSWDDIDKVAVNVSSLAKILADKFWPGPLTMIFERNPRLPLCTTAGLETVAVRMPSHPGALSFLYEAGVPVAAPSANISGRPSPTRVEDVVEDMAGKVAAIIDGGTSNLGLESTVLDILASPPRILRFGGVAREDLLTIMPQVESYVFTGKNHNSSSPGMKYRHYAPQAPLLLFKGEFSSVREALFARMRKEVENGKKVALLMFSPVPPGTCADKVVCLNNDIGKGLFAALRDFDKSGTDIILAECPGRKGLGAAITDRLQKAAGDNVIEVV